MFKRITFCLIACTFLHADFIPPHDPRLTQPAQELSQEEIKSPETQELIELMFQISRGEREDMNKGVLVGLAAPQIGVLKQVILVDVGFDSKLKTFGELKVFINPKIIESSAETELDREGCYSVDHRVCGLVPRHQWVKIEALDRDGYGFCAKYEGLTARIMQHEIDHLNGIRFPDRVGPHGTLHWVEEDEYPQYRKEYETWPRTLSWDKWEAMKNGKSD